MNSTPNAIKRDEKTGDPLFIDRRELRLRYEIPVKDIYPFFDGLREGRVLASKCKICLALYFPPQGSCPTCRKSDMDWVELGPTAKLLAVTKVYIKPQSFAEEEDYILGVGEFPEGVKALARLLFEGSRMPKIGTQMRIAVTKDSGENPLYVFVPTEPGSNEPAP